MNRINKSEKIVFIIISVMFAALFVSSFFEKNEETIEVYKPKININSVIELGSVRDTSASLVVGYNYLLLKQFANDNSQTISIRTGDRKQNKSYIDSLRSGAIDILVLPFRDSLIIDSIIVSTPIDSTSIWLMRHDDHPMMSSFHKWFDGWCASEEYESKRAQFLIDFNPFKFGKGYGRLSPYDDTIKSSAEQLGWDWRLLAALMYKESKFHIDALSKSGAFGLMQLMPATASLYGLSNSLDPEMSILTASKLLEKHMIRYNKKAANNTECCKFSIAAYNAGVGRINDCVNYASSKGIDTQWWDNVASVVPEMVDESIVDTGLVKFGTFKGKETIGHVNAVLSIYQRFCIICP